MAKTIDQIRAQIAKLQAQEHAILQKEVAGVIAKIRVAVNHYGITAEQIFGTSIPAKKASGKAGMKAFDGAAKATKKPRRSKATELVSAEKLQKATSASKGIKVAAKYKDEAGNTWSGRGSQPRWLRAAIEGGRQLQDFAVA